MIKTEAKYLKNQRTQILYHNLGLVELISALRRYAEWNVVNKFFLSMANTNVLLTVGRCAAF